LVAWVIAGLLAAFIALAFAQCAAICPQVGGSYAYTRAAFGPLLGFLTGWALYIAGQDAAFTASGSASRFPSTPSSVSARLGPRVGVAFKPSL
jgi:basic amino acid/polyamine antiporter, APA family